MIWSSSTTLWNLLTPPSFSFSSGYYSSFNASFIQIGLSSTTSFGSSSNITLPKSPSDGSLTYSCLYFVGTIVIFLFVNLASTIESKLLSSFLVLFNLNNLRSSSSKY